MNIVEIIRMILLICLLVLIIAYIIYSKNINIIKEWAFDFVVKAEETILGTKKGEEKLTYVINRIRELLPWYLKIIFSTTLLKNIVQCSFDILEDALKSKSKLP